jgi:hypothetical protein
VVTALKWGAGSFEAVAEEGRIAERTRTAAVKRFRLGVIMEGM